MEQKTCRVCKQIKSVDMFGRLRDGYAYECRSCKSDLDRAYRERHKESIRKQKSAHYIANSDHIRAKAKAWYEENKQYAIARQSEYAGKRKEWYSQYKREWREKNAARLSVANAVYRLEHRERVQLATKEWFRKFPEKRKEHGHARRVRLRGAGGRFTGKQIDDLRVLQKGKCACCKTSLKKAGEHIDHVVPISKGGSGDILNIQLLCPPCNLRKNAKDPLDFMQSRGFLL